MTTLSAFTSDRYTLRRQVFALTGTFRIYNASEQMVLFSRQKMFKLREDIRVYSDENMTQEVLLIQARNIMDFSAAYDVFDPYTQAHIGTLRRKGFRSIVQDEWEILDPGQNLIAILKEDSAGLAMLRRLLLGSLLPQNYDVLIGDQRVVDIRQRFNLFRYELDLDFSLDSFHRIDRRLGIAAAILLAAIEGRQE